MQYLFFHFFFFLFLKWDGKHTKRSETLINFWVFETVAAVAAKSLLSCLTLCDPIDGSPPGFPSLGFSRQEHWSGLPFPSPMHESEKWKWSRSVMSDSSDHMDCSLPLSMGFSRQKYWRMLLPYIKLQSSLKHFWQPMAKQTEKINSHLAPIIQTNCLNNKGQILILEKLMIKIAY